MPRGYLVDGDDEAEEEEVVVGMGARPSCKLVLRE
jgi:hypothetical protein